MPTRDRRAVVPRSIELFLRQDYEARELVVLDDGADPVADLIPDDPRIRYVRLEEPAILGEKRNLACEIATGEILVHWDDDDWYAPNRLSIQVAALEAGGAEICGSRRIRYLDPATAQAWVYEYPKALGRWVAGNVLCYRRSLWDRHRFRPIAVGEDTVFVWSCATAQVAEIEDSSYVVGILHSTNTSARPNRGPWWSACPIGEIHSLLGSDAELFR